jgi:peptide deformylase
MPLKPILMTPNPHLSKPCAVVQCYGEDVRELVRDLFDTADAQTRVGERRARAVGLAAPQIGVLKQVVVLTLDTYRLAMINPRIVKHKKQVEMMYESCFSEPKVQKEVERYTKIHVDYDELLPTGQLRPAQQAFTDFAARVVQHEIDHLNGILLGGNA